MASKPAKIIITDSKIDLSTRAKSLIAHRYSLNLVVVGWKYVGVLVAKGVLVKHGNAYYTSGEIGYIRNIARAGTSCLQALADRGELKKVGNTYYKPSEYAARFGK